MEPTCVALGQDVARLDIRGRNEVSLTLFCAEYNGANGERVPASSFRVDGIRSLAFLRDAIDIAIAHSAVLPESEIPF